MTKRPVSAIGNRRPISEYARVAAALGGNPRYKVTSLKHRVDSTKIQICQNKCTRHCSYEISGNYKFPGIQFSIKIVVFYRLQNAACLKRNWCYYIYYRLIFSLSSRQKT